VLPSAQTHFEEHANTLSGLIEMQGWQGTPVARALFELTLHGDLGCGVGYYK
jgi:hypothetical protein